eukprot:1177652-Prorocentrum_minimum.AAC.3
MCGFETETCRFSPGICRVCADLLEFGRGSERTFLSSGTVIVFWRAALRPSTNTVGARFARRSTCTPPRCHAPGQSQRPQAHFRTRPANRSARRHTFAHARPIAVPTGTLSHTPDQSQRPLPHRLQGSFTYQTRNRPACKHASVCARTPKGPQHRLQTTNQGVQYMKGGTSFASLHQLPTTVMFQIPRSFHSRVLQVGSGTQDLSILGPLATPVFCEADDRVMWGCTVAALGAHLVREEAPRYIPHQVREEATVGGHMHDGVCVRVSVGEGPRVHRVHSIIMLLRCRQ